MIEVRAKAEFKADFPYDGVQDKSDFLLSPGKGITAAIAELLRRIGCEVSDPLHAHEHGWELEIRFKDESMWGQVTSIDVGEGLLLFLDGAFMGNSSSKPAYLEAIARLDLEMQHDPRFHDIRWSRWREPEGPAVGAPLDIGLDRLPEPMPRRGWFGWGAKNAAARAQDPARIRNKAKIGANFPDDSVQEDGKIVRWGGGGVTAAIAEILVRLGAEVSEPLSGAEHGWRLDVRFGSHTAQWQIEDGGGFVYLDIDDRGVVDRPEWIDLVVRFNAELHRDPRFHQIRWYRRGEINMRGLSSDRPVHPAS